jgi:shikimate dehydrogenase
MIEKYFYSLSKHPGKTGELYYKILFEDKKLPYTYAALECNNLIRYIKQLLAIGAAGVSISMPYKTEIISLLDDRDTYVNMFNSCNTVIIDDGKLKGYNTDYYGAIYAISQIPKDMPVSILGDGAMGRMFKRILPGATVFSRKLGNWGDRYNIAGAVINCTSFGTVGFTSPFEKLPDVSVVIDLAISANDLKNQTEEKAITYIPGRDFYRHQFIKQFEIYTGVPLTIEDITKYD